MCLLPWGGQPAQLSIVLSSSAPLSLLSNPSVESPSPALLSPLQSGGPSNQAVQLLGEHIIPSLPFSPSPAPLPNNPSRSCGPPRHQWAHHFPLSIWLLVRTHLSALSSSSILLSFLLHRDWPRSGEDLNFHPQTSKNPTPRTWPSFPTARTLLSFLYNLVL